MTMNAFIYNFSPANDNMQDLMLIQWMFWEARFQAQLEPELTMYQDSVSFMYSEGSG